MLHILLFYHCMVFDVQYFALRVSCLLFRAWGLAFRASGFVFRASYFVFRVSCFGFQVDVWCLAFGALCFVFRTSHFVIRVSCFGFRSWDLLAILEDFQEVREVDPLKKILALCSMGSTV